MRSVFSVTDRLIKSIKMDNISDKIDSIKSANCTKYLGVITDWNLNTNSILRRLSRSAHKLLFFRIIEESKSSTSKAIINYYILIWGRQQSKITRNSSKYHYYKQYVYNMREITFVLLNILCVFSKQLRGILFWCPPKMSSINVF